MKTVAGFIVKLIGIALIIFFIYILVAPIVYIDTYRQGIESLQRGDK